MSGNAWQWTADWYDPKYYASSPARNPTGPATGQERVMRGGSWAHQTLCGRTAFRGSRVPFSSRDDHGFRVAVSAAVP